MCEAANSVVQGQAQEEKLIAAAKAVASSTAQLLIACQVKADANSESNRRLQVCTLYRVGAVIQGCVLCGDSGTLYRDCNCYTGMASP